MIYKRAGKFVYAIPESVEDSINIESKVAVIVKAGYQVHMRRWGTLQVTDPALRFAWEAEDIVWNFIVKSFIDHKTLQAVPTSLHSKG
jgi:hypothetical protein